MKKIILASTSPRRKELLEMVGLKFRAVPSHVEEKFNPRLSPRGQAEFLSEQKAEAVVPRYKDAIIIGSDQVVDFENESIAKPETVENAKGMLDRFQGKMLRVFTAFTIIDVVTKKSVTKSVETKVFLRKMSKKEIDWYVSTGEPLDKAGGFAIQGKGSLFIEKIEGDYNNVVGLPVAELIDELRRFGITFW